MAREELSIHVKAEDDASKVLDEVAQKADKLEGESADIKVGADTSDADQKLDKVDQQADKLDQQTTDVDVTADISDADNKLDRIDRQADKLDRQKTDIKVTADTTQAEGALTGLRTKATTAFSGLGDAIKANLAGAALGAGTALAAFAAKAVGDFQEVALGAGQLRDSLGVTADEASRLQEVAGDVGVAVGTLESAIGKMNKAASASPAAFAAIGAEIAKNKDGTTDVTQTFLNAIDALNKIPDAADRAVAAQKIFGKGWTDIAELVAQGADGVSEALASIESGKIMDDADIARAREFRDTLDELKGIAESASITLGSNLVDSIQDVKTIVDQVKGPFEDLAEVIQDVEDAVPGGGAAGEGIRGWLLGIAAPATQIPRLIGAAADAIRKFRGEADAIDVESVTALGARLWGETKEATAEAAEGVEGVGLAYQGLGERLSHLSPQGQKWLEQVRALAVAYDDAALAMKGMEPDEGFDRAIDQLNKASELDFAAMALDTVGAFDDIKGALKEAESAGTDWAKVDFSPESVDELKGIPEELQAVTDSVIGMRDSIQTELAAAFDTGGVQAFTEKAGFFAQQITDQFLPIFQEMTGDAGLAQQKVNELLTELGLMPEQVSVQIELTRLEQATAALGTFSAFIDALKPEKSIAIRTAIAEGDIAAAFNLLNTELINAGYEPIMLPVDADIVAAEGKVDEIVNYADDATGTVTVEGDAAPAKSEISDVETAKYQATIDADADAAAAAADLLEVTTRHRNATIYAVADANAADSRLDAVASQSRTATITADAHTGSAESELANLARPRTASINVTVHRTEVLTRVDGGG